MPSEICRRKCKREGPQLRRTENRGQLPAWRKATTVSSTITVIPRSKLLLSWLMQLLTMVIVELQQLPLLHSHRLDVEPSVVHRWYRREPDHQQAQLLSHQQNSTKIVLDSLAQQHMCLKMCLMNTLPRTCTKTLVLAQVLDVIK